MVRVIRGSSFKLQGASIVIVASDTLDYKSLQSFMYRCLLQTKTNSDIKFVSPYKTEANRLQIITNLGHRVTQVTR